MSTFTNYTSRGVGTTATAIGEFTAASATTVIGLSVANTTANTVQVSVILNDGTNDTYLVKDMDVVPGSAQVVVGGDQKVVLVAGNSIKVTSSAASSIDAVMSVLVV